MRSRLWYKTRATESDSEMGALIIRWIMLVVAVWVTTYIVPGIRYDTGASLVIAALVLSILNTFVRPLLLLISLPFVVVTLGLFVFIINALLVWLTGRLVDGFHVDGFWSALGASLIISLVSLFLGRFQRGARRVRATTPHAAAEPQRTPPPGKGPIIDV